MNKTITHGGAVWQGSFPFQKSFNAFSVRQRMMTLANLLLCVNLSTLPYRPAVGKNKLERR